MFLDFLPKKTQTQMVMKLKNSNCDRTQIVTKLENSNYEKTQKLKL